MKAVTYYYIVVHHEILKMTTSSPSTLKKKTYMAHIVLQSEHMLLKTHRLTYYGMGTA